MDPFELALSLKNKKKHKKKKNNNENLTDEKKTEVNTKLNET